MEFIGGESVPVDVIDRDNELLPETVSLPSYCCVRGCDRTATTLVYERASLCKPGETLTIFAFCSDHVLLLPPDQISLPEAD